MTATRRRALLVGIGAYDHIGSQLPCCPNDALQMKEALAHHDPPVGSVGVLGDPNFECRVLGPSTHGVVTENDLSAALEAWLFDPSFDGESLFYFSGHGDTHVEQGVLCVTDQAPPRGIRVDDLITMSQQRRAHRRTTIILDCCHAGAAGNDALAAVDLARIPRETTVIAACMPREEAFAGSAVSFFTSALLAGLHGGAADLVGNVSAASMFAYAQTFLAKQKQHPVLKAHITDAGALRRCRSSLTPGRLDELPDLFPPTAAGLPGRIKLDPSWDPEVVRQLNSANADPAQRSLPWISYASRGRSFPIETNDANVQRRLTLKVLEGNGLVAVTPFAEKLGFPREQIDVTDTLFWAAYFSQEVALTPLGKAQWDLARLRRT